MGEGIIIAIISGILTLAGTIITVWAGNNKTRQNIEVNQAVTNEKLNMLTENVRDLNDFSRHLPVMEEQIKNLNNRVSILEGGKK